MEEDIITLKEQLQQADNFISEFENDCYELAKGIPRKVCERAIKRMNSEMKIRPLLGMIFLLVLHFLINYQFFYNHTVLMI